ncbi:MAG: NAD-dependent DNA ligase LigA [Myxococcota bacterium]|nr:NAD-dependent DNA ligase LigA [Myxococcota bacterium]
MDDTIETLKARYAELIAEIRRHDYLYYVEDAPEISDRAYDRLFQELKQIEAHHPALKRSDSPTERIGAPPKDGFVRVRRAQRMYSLDNTYNEDEINEFMARIRTNTSGKDPAYVVEPKLDGASIELTYQQGQLVLAATRGDGAVGEDVTAGIRTIRSLPLGIDEVDDIIVRGEVFINRADLQAVNQERAADGAALFANPRNAASGSLRLLDPSATARRPLRIFLYELVQAPSLPLTHWACLKRLRDLGLPTHRLERRCETPGEVMTAIRSFSAMRQDLPYDVDGVVIKVDALDVRHQLGHTARFPRWAVAYKFESERAQTLVLGITVQVGRTGTLTPVAELKPVELAGTTVSRASLHNEDEIKSRDIRVGDTVFVEKAGDIIPQVVGVIAAETENRGDPFSMPRVCPVCGAPTSRREGQARWQCTNQLACPGQLKASITHFARRAAMDIEHLGPAIVNQLVDKGLVKDPADLFTLTVDAVAGLDRMAEKSATNLIDAIQASRSRTLDRVLNGLGIPLVGEVAAKKLAKRYGSLAEFATQEPDVECDELADIEGIGPKIACSVRDTLADTRFMAVVHKLLDLNIATVTSYDPREMQQTGPLAGASFCVTGKLSQPRQAFHDAIRAAGGDVHTTVKKGTHYLVVGDAVGKAKIERAKKMGTKIIDERELADLINEGGTRDSQG